MAVRIRRLILAPHPHLLARLHMQYGIFSSDIDHLFFLARNGKLIIGNLFAFAKGFPKHGAVYITGTS